MVLYHVNAITKSFLKLSVLLNIETTFNTGSKTSIDPNKEFRTKHRYYYQVQFQMYVLDVQATNFLVYSPVKSGTKSILVTVFKDNNFIKEMVEKSFNYFKTIILPEIVTRKSDPKY